MNKVTWGSFLKDVFIAALGSYGGPEAHYGVFSSQFVQKKQYLSEEELTEMIGLYALVPGPSSTQTITAIGYHVGGPILAILTFLVWAFPAILIMALFGVFFTQVDANDSWKPMLSYLPAVAVGFIIYAAFSLSRKVLKSSKEFTLFAVMFVLSLLFVGYSMWVVPGLLLLGGFIFYYLNSRTEERSEHTPQDTPSGKPRWIILAVVVGIALLNEWLIVQFDTPLVTLFTSFYRYGYSVIGGGQIVIPLMIQDLVESQSLISISDFLSGYAIDQAVPGPLFSFAAFVSARSFPGHSFSLLAGIIGGLSIFLPGTLLVFFMFPLWKAFRKSPGVKQFLRGVSVTAAALIVMTAIKQIIALPQNLMAYAVAAVSTLLLLSNKVPAPIIVVLAALLGFVA